MKSAVEDTANQETEFEGVDFVELGRASEETRGSTLGHSWDNGFGVKFP